MNNVRLSIIVPTMGRTTLFRTLASIEDQLNDDDEIIVVADPAHDVEAARNTVARFVSSMNEAQWLFVVFGESNWGNAQRNFGIKHAKGTHITIMDDDDIYTPNAFETFRDYASNVPVIFKMHYEGHYLLWQNRGEITCGNFGTPCFLMPNVKGKTPKFGMHYAGDADYIILGNSNFGHVEWREEVVAQIRPHEQMERKIWTMKKPLQ